MHLMYLYLKLMQPVTITVKKPTSSTMLQNGSLCKSSQIDPGLFEMIQFGTFNLLQKFILRIYSVGME